MSAKSLVKHKAHQVYKINKINPIEHDLINREKYLNKFFGILLDMGDKYDFYSDEEFCLKSRMIIKK